MNGITVSMMTPQNFSIPAGYNQVITFIVDPFVTPSLIDCKIFWNVYSEFQGIPNWDELLIAKSSLDSPTPAIVGLDSPLSFTVQMYTADTIDMLRNYYHEASIVNAIGETIGGSWGIMAVLDTENRP